MTKEETDDQIARLIPIVTRFRNAMERLRREWKQIVEEADDRPDSIDIFGAFQDFPRGCCDKTAFLLVRYLVENGFPDVRCVNGDDKQAVVGLHTWVCVGAVHVDLTADQFKQLRPRPKPITVTANVIFHNRFTVFSEFIYDSGWTEWHRNADWIAAAEWLYAIVKRLADTDEVT